MHQTQEYPICEVPSGCKCQSVELRHSRVEWRRPLRPPNHIRHLCCPKEEAHRKYKNRLDFIQQCHPLPIPITTEEPSCLFESLLALAFAVVTVRHMVETQHPKCDSHRCHSPVSQVAEELQWSHQHTKSHTVSRSHQSY